MEIEFTGSSLRNSGQISFGKKSRAASRRRLYRKNSEKRIFGVCEEAMARARESKREVLVEISSLLSEAPQLSIWVC